MADRVMKKLASWKTKFLSFARRAVLVKSVMSAILNHVMQGAALPNHLCDKLDKINRDPRKKVGWGSSQLELRMLLCWLNSIGVCTMKKKLYGHGYC